MKLKLTIYKNYIKIKHIDIKYQLNYFEFDV
jgi:hypothetical protein